jgi:hypothetical protein
MTTNDWTLIDAHPKSMNLTNATDCFPEMIPVLAKKCFKDSRVNCPEWTKAFPMQFYDGTSEYGQFKRIKAMSYTPISYKDKSDYWLNERKWLFGSLIERYTTSTTDKTHYLMIQNSHDGYTHGLFPIQFDITDYFFKYPRMVPFAISHQKAKIAS